MRHDEMGGPAFPLVGQWYGEKLAGQLRRGMTLWDFYAAAALQAAIIEIDGYADYESAAISAGRFADAMIAERRKRMEGGGNG